MKCRLCKTTDNVKLYRIGTRNRHLCVLCYSSRDSSLETLKPRKPPKPLEGYITEKQLAVASKARQMGTRTL